MSKVHRDASSGEFVTAEQAQQNPAGTVTETIEPIKYLATWMTKNENMSLLQIRGSRIEMSFHLPVAAVEAIMKAGKAS